MYKNIFNIDGDSMENEEIKVEKNENVALFKREEIDYIDVAKRRLFLAWEGLDKKMKKHIAIQNLIAEFEER